MAHWYVQNGFFVIQALGYRLEIIDRKRNPLLSQTVFPCYGPKEYRLWRFAIKFSKV